MKTKEEKMEIVKAIQTKQTKGEKLTFVEQNIINMFDKKIKNESRRVKRGLIKEQVKFPYKKK